MSGVAREKRAKTEGGAVTLSAAPDGSLQAGDARCYLLCFAGDSSAVFHLPTSGEVVIGRAPQCDLYLEDRAVSRQHAQLLITDTEVRVTDLDSRHGTRVNGERLRRPVYLIAGDVMTIGNQTLVFHRFARPGTSRGLLDPTSLRQRLEEEIKRSVDYDRNVALLLFDLAGPSAGSSRADATDDSDDAAGVTPVDRAGIVAALAGHVRLIDAVGFIGQSQLAIIMPEIGTQHAGAAASVLLAELPAPVQAGISSCADDGCDADTLISAARAAAHAAGPGNWTTAAQAASVVDIAGRAVVVADPAMRRVYDLIEKLAASDLPILITGDTGTGKEIAAAAIHHYSDRNQGPFVPINCAALPTSLVESELFGHEKGAFTDARAARPGLFERARGGTVFLDELGELDPAIQAKLLRVIETQRVTRVGDVRERAIDVRLVAATNRDLSAEISAGRFRQDLFFRLSVARIVLPPLRDRRREVAILARLFVAKACQRAKRPPLAIAPAAMHRLCAHTWPGNVRELENAMKYAAATATERDTEIDVWHLPEGIVPADDAATDKAPVGELSSPGQAPRIGPDEFRPIKQEVQELERARMIEALEATGQVQNKAAALISMPLRTFVTKLERYKIPTGRKQRG
ncbi:MAG: sigma 54-interacting transcriptional regulator [Proteobacteria bacterium]|nr:sigma 54-interacting transcriptional regulator [Pseudomonadota bacterium]